MIDRALCHICATFYFKSSASIGKEIEWVKEKLQQERGPKHDCAFCVYHGEQ